MISIITPWHNASELCQEYERSHVGAQIITIDNASEPEHAEVIKEMTKRMGGVYIKNKTNRLFAYANNQGYKKANGDVVMFLNNDTAGSPGWLRQVEDDVKDGALYGKSAGVRYVNGIAMPYIEGWCIAGTKATWDKVGGWPENLPGMYWEDNILCLEALKQDIRLMTRKWYVEHINNYTSARTAGSFDHSGANQAEFERLVMEWRS